MQIPCIKFLVSQHYLIYVLTRGGAIVHIEILSMKKFQPNEKAIYIALPVLAIECEATPPLQNYLDAYEETVLKLVSIGLSARGIAGTLNATESLIEEILDRLDRKNYVEKEIGKPWRVTEDGNKYLNGTIDERESNNSEFGYMFVNAIKKDILPFFYRGDINQISLFRGIKLPEKLTIGGDEIKTFENFKVKRTKLKEAYKKYFKNADASKQYDDGDITLNEAIDLFEGLDSFDEDDYIETMESAEIRDESERNENMFIRALNCPVKYVYLTMRIIIDTQYPGGYRVESPFDFNGIDNNYFLRQIQWLAATGTTYLGDEELNSFLDREIRKLSPLYKNTDKDFSVFVLEKMPLLKISQNKFSYIYEDMARIYSLMQRQKSLIEKENIVNNLSRSVLESLFNTFFKNLKNDVLKDIQKNVNIDLELNNCSNYGCKYYINQIVKGTSLDATQLKWGYRLVQNSIGRLPNTHGNSILEKFINVVILNYYYGTSETRKFLSAKNIQQLYDLTDKLNQIRRKVSHDTNDRFETKDYEFYMANVFKLVNGLLEAYKED